MNVKLYTAGTAGRDYTACYRTSPSASEQARPQALGTAGKYDQLTIHKTQYPADTESFAALLTQETKKDVSSGASPERVEELRRQVAAGTYTPDAGLIARRMLHYS